MSQELVLQDRDSEAALVSVLKALEIQKTLEGEPVLAALRRYPAEPARYAAFPEDLHPRLLHALRSRG